MASPQLEDGFTKIANEILEHLSQLHLSPNEWRVLLTIFRKTYGYQKKSDYIANAQIMCCTGQNKSVVSKALKNLLDMNLIVREGKFIGFQKNWEEWRKLSISITKVVKTDNSKSNQKLSILTPELSKSTTKVVSPRVTQKKKDNIQKKVYGEFQNILLSDEEVTKLKERFNGQFDSKVENLSRYIASVGKKYKSHYATILKWSENDPKPVVWNPNGPPATNPPDKKWNPYG